MVMWIQPDWKRQVLSFLNLEQLCSQKGVLVIDYMSTLMSDLAEIRKVEGGRKMEIRVPTALTILQTASGAIDANGLPCSCESQKGIGFSTGASLTGVKS
jgi:hypothetical protein